MERVCNSRKEESMTIFTAYGLRPIDSSLCLRGSVGTCLPCYCVTQPGDDIDKFAVLVVQRSDKTTLSLLINSLCLFSFTNTIHFYQHSAFTQSFGD